MSARDAYNPADLVVADLLNAARNPLEQLVARLEAVPGAEMALAEARLALAHIKGAWMFYPAVPR